MGQFFKITNWGRRDYKWRVVSDNKKRGKRITNMCRDYKKGRKDYKLGKGLQIGAGHGCLFCLTIILKIPLADYSDEKLKGSNLFSFSITIV